MGDLAAGDFVGHDDTGGDEHQQEGADEFGGEGFEGDILGHEQNSLTRCLPVGDFGRSNVECRQARPAPVLPKVKGEKGLFQITRNERWSMQSVQGFGGFFFRAKDPEGLAKWYQEHLGINPAPTSMEMEPWVTEAGVTVFSPFDVDTDYFASDKAFMLNFRVADLDAMVAQLKSADIEVSHESAMEGIGRFARIHDPEGNAIELWEPAL